MVAGNGNDKDKYSEVRVVFITYDTSIPIERIAIEIKTYSGVYQLATEDVEVTWSVAKEHLNTRNSSEWHTPSRKEMFLILQHIEEINLILENLENNGDGERIIGNYWTYAESMSGESRNIYTFSIEKSEMSSYTGYNITLRQSYSIGTNKLRLIRRVE